MYYIPVEKYLQPASTQVKTILENRRIW